MRFAVPITTLLLAACALAPTALGQTAYPGKAVRIVVPMPPAGSSDVLSRLIADKLGALWSQSVWVDNKPGAGSIVGTEAVAKSAADGHTLGMVANSFTINPSLYSRLPYDTLKDFTAVTQLISASLVLAAHPSVPANSIAELVALARAKPGALTFASPGTGTLPHLTGEMLKTAAGSEMLHVPYKGLAPGEIDLLAGRVTLMFNSLFLVQPHAASGKLKVLAVMDDRRHARLPSVQTMAETFPGMVVATMYGIVVPAHTGREQVNRLHADLARVLAAPEVKKRLDELDFVPVASPPEAFERFIRAEVQRWARVVKESGAKAD